MPKKLAEGEAPPDPVRSRLASEGRVAELAGRAAAPPPKGQMEPERVDAAPRTTPGASQERFLERTAEDEGGARRRVTAPPGTIDVEALSVDRKTRFTASEAEANSQLVRLLKRLTGTKPSEAAITRILWALLREAEPGLKQEARKGFSLRRPANGPSLEMAAYERDLGRVLLAALKSLEP